MKSTFAEASTSSKMGGSHLRRFYELIFGENIDETACFCVIRGLVTKDRKQWSSVCRVQMWMRCLFPRE